MIIDKNAIPVIDTRRRVTSRHPFHGAVKADMPEMFGGKIRGNVTNRFLDSGHLVVLQRGAAAAGEGAACALATMEIA
jgi:hypothetical protein